MDEPLFSCPTSQPVADAEPEIVTPLGAVTLDADVGLVLISDLVPSSVRSVGRGGRLLNWTLDGLTAELLLCRPSLTLPEGMAVDGCWAGVWRLRASTIIERPEFSCRWGPGYRWMEGGPESGEGLDAQTWTGDAARVTVGTVDAEWLAGHALRGLLPRRWADLLGWSYGGTSPDPDTGRVDPVVYMKDGFSLVLPTLEAGEQCQVQFVVTWSSAPRGDGIDDLSTWFAVERSPEDILSGAGCL